MDITYQYTKQRGQFGRQVQFCETASVLCDSIPPARAEHARYALRNPVHCAVQHAACLAQRATNTERAVFSSTGTNHAEGGWPRDVIVTDPEATQRYRRKVEKEEAYIRCVTAASSGLEHYADQNNAVDMYNIYYSEMAPTAAHERGSCRTVNAYRDPPPTRPVRAVSWRPDGREFAAAYADLDFDRAPLGPTVAYMWDLESANSPSARLESPCALLDLQYNPRVRGMLAGGLASGQVVAWDARAGPRPSLLTPPHTAHRDLVRRVLFVNAKSGQELFSAGPDGAVKWWDLRAPHAPTDEMIIDVARSGAYEASMATAYGVSALEFEPTIPTRFMVGTENGLVLGGNRKGKTPSEKLPARFSAHVGPVVSVERNPGFLKNFLTVGEWTARVWSEECREAAVLWTPPHRHGLSAGAWSPTRTSVVLLAARSGVLGVWDLLRHQQRAVLSVQVCPEALLCLAAHEAGQLVALGSEKGSVYMVELSGNMAQADKQDKLLLTAILEREAKRERILETRLREIRLRLKQAEEGSAGGGVSAADLDAAHGDRDLAAAAADYFQQVKKEHAAFV